MGIAVGLLVVVVYGFVIQRNLYGFIYRADQLFLKCTLIPKRRKFFFDKGGDVIRFFFIVGF